MQVDLASIRPAAIEDVPALWDCDALAQPGPDRKRHIERAVQRQQCLVAEVEGQVAGFTVLHHEFFDNAFISLVVVRPGFRRRGVGSQLIRAAELACRTAKLFSSTNASNLAAQHLLRKAGFSRSGVVDNLDTRDPEYIYFKEVASRER